MSDNNQEPTQGKGFTVTDKRFASKSTEEKEQILRETQTKQKEEPSPVPQQEEKTQDKPQAVEEITLSGLIFSLSHSAMVQMGEIPDPITQKKEKDLPLAKQSIDLIAILEEKTKGNLTQDEELLMKNALYDLRMRFVQNSS